MTVTMLVLFQFPSNGKALSDAYFEKTLEQYSGVFQFPSNGKALSDTDNEEDK